MVSNIADQPQLCTKAVFWKTQSTQYIL